MVIVSGATTAYGTSALLIGIVLLVMVLNTCPILTVPAGNCALATGGKSTVVSPEALAAIEKILTILVPPPLLV